jgi:hypothetical protein
MCHQQLEIGCGCSVCKSKNLRRAWAIPPNSVTAGPNNAFVSSVVINHQISIPLPEEVTGMNTPAGSLGNRRPEWAIPHPTRHCNTPISRPAWFYHFPVSSCLTGVSSAWMTCRSPNFSRNRSTNHAHYAFWLLLKHAGDKPPPALGHDFNKPTDLR